jgi:GT2 family glycosyltransferase
MERPRQILGVIVLVASVLFAAGYVAHVLVSIGATRLNPLAWAVLSAKVGIELVASAYGMAFFISAIAFLFMADGRQARPSRSGLRRHRVAVVYLSCDDADWSALESFLSLSYQGPLLLIIQDDSRDSAKQAALDRMSAELMRRRDWDVRLLRRPERTGGKAGALNYVLDETGHLHDFFVLCDNDSTVLDDDTIERALSYVEKSDTAVVQFRSVPVADPNYCAANRRLAESIGAFHAFLAPAARYGWMPFIGHNALLRTSAVRAIGGFTSGFFSDDLDLTVRLNVAGYRVVYAPGIRMGEKHPPSYTAFRKRSYKWAYGCVQTLRAHWRTVLTTPRLSLAEKVSFFQFAGFYCLQCLLLFYLFFMLLLVPFGVLGSFVPDPVVGLSVGVILIGLVYAPLLSFYVKTAEARTRGWGWTVTLCGLVYGGTDFSVLRGVVDAWRGRRRAWIPTNGVAAHAVDLSLYAEAAIGLLMLAVPVVFMPELLYLSCWYLFAGKFLFGPALSLVYRDRVYDEMAMAPGAPGLVRVLDRGSRSELERIGA